MAIAAVLKITWNGLGLVLDFHRHWIRLPVQPMISVDGKSNSTIPMRMKRKFTDIVPVMVGRVTLRADAMAETARKQRARVRLCGLHWLNAIAVVRAPERLIEPTYILALTGKD